MPYTRKPLLFCLFASLLGPAASAAPSLTAKVDGTTVAVEIDGKLFTQYKFGRDLKKPYLWPLAGPRSGKSVTTESSEPYPHHNSMWFGCDHLNGRDYWHHQRPDGNIFSQGPQVAVAKGEEVVITDISDWTPRKGDTLDPPVLRDYRRIAVRAPSADIRVIDFTIVLVPLTQITITKTNHSLFALRMAPALSVKSGGTMVDAAGLAGEKATFGKAAPWMDSFGTRDGAVEGAAILQHPSNRWYPSPWFTRDYGFFSPTPMQWLPKPLVLKEGEAVVLAYRVVVHSGTAKDAKIAQRFTAFAKEKPELPEPFVAATLAGALGKLPAAKTYEFGQSRKALFAIQQAVSLASGRAKETRDRIATALAKALAEADTTPAARRFFCRQLGLLGGSGAVQSLAAQLGSKEEHVGETAVVALARIGTPAASKALAAALPTLEARVRLTAVGCLGETGADAVPVLAGVLKDADPQVVQLAAGGLARIGTVPALQAVHGAWKGAAGNAKSTLTAALLKGLGRCPANPTSAGICRELAASKLPASSHPAVLTLGMRLLPRAEARRFYQKALRDSRPEVRSVALAQVASLSDMELVTVALGEYGQLAPVDRITLLQALATRGDKQFVALPRRALAAESATVVSAACSALAVLGSVADVNPLLARAQQADGAAALGALGRITGPGVGDAIGAAMDAAEGKAKGDLVDLLVKRGEPTGAKWLLKAVRDKDRNVRKDALKGLGALGDQSHRDAALSMLNEDLGSASKRAPYESCAGVLLRRFPGEAGASEVCLGRMAAATPAGRGSLLRTLGILGEPAGLAALVEATKATDAKIQDAAIRALAEWPTAAAFQPLLQVATETKELTHHVLALRGCHRLLVSEMGTDPDVLEKGYTACREIARRDEERKLFAYDPKGVAVRDLKVAAKGTYRVHRAGLRKGALWSTDRKYTFTVVPPELANSTYIETVMNHRSVADNPDFMTFQVAETVDVFVGFDNRCSKLPAWLKDWKKTKMVLRTTTNSCHLIVYRKSFPAGRAAVGSCRAPGVQAMYTVAVKTASK